ncbi:efflux RND transporter periplasmic adaptor subunit [Sporomusa malonica]|uniref:RND family efflux transporter, MFP subunit n=1 Tax=Sporomusa malonica TaxID=112901 RepID=A0A1W1YBS6_9FIRM|nr:efflux RND transporter periplasmic adaptor subunit [Sporomusa malonica]SMC33670.1 RND family efflux transporter, MFP subunit [Sporomusa malonica]
MNFNSRLRFWVLAILFACVVGFYLYEWGGLGPQKVVAAKVETGTLKPTVFGIGTVQAKMNYNIGPTQTGRILRLYVDQGDSVKAGQVLGEVDPVDLEQRITGSNAALVSSQHNAETARAQLQDAMSRNQLAQTEAVRYEKLFESGAISKELLESKQNNAEVAQAVLASTVSAFQAAQSMVDQAAADYHGQIEQKRNFMLISPVDGMVVARQAEAGSTLVAGQAVFIMIDPKTLWVQTRIDQARFSGVALGQSAEIVLRSNQTEVLCGTVDRLEVRGDTVTEERFVDVKFTNIPSSIFLGDLADVTIKLPEVTNSLYIPVAAIKTINGEDRVWVVQNGKAYCKLVKTGVRTVDGKAQIITGLKQDEIVILFNNSKAQLAEGTRVRLVAAL